MITSENGIYQHNSNSTKSDNTSSVNLYKMPNQTEEHIRDDKEQREVNCTIATME